MKVKNILSSVSPKAVLAISISVLCQPVFANPTGAEVINGQVIFSQPNINTLQINNSNGSIINWQSFSINANELTHFQQSGANSSILNQVVGNNVSNIFGSLTSNGQVYLINQHGIIFGENSVVNTAGFIASTLNLSNQDFLQGKLNFEGINAADILNDGFITAGADGSIALIAPNIINNGVIKVEQGDVILAAGEKVTLTSLHASDVGFEVQSSENTVTNLGSVTTDGGAIGMFAGSLTHSGVIAATALELDENGNVILVAKNNLSVAEDAVVSANGENGGRILIQNENGTTWVSGAVEANGTNGVGGVVDVLGQQVGLIDNASVSADGSQGGGQIHVGGNYQGIGLLQNASGTYVGENVSLSTNAIESGDGGEVIVWADEATRVFGSISATGGELNGNGGFVETSGKVFLDVANINLDLTAENGEAGSWLLDPYNLTISTGTDATVGGGPNFSAAASASNLNTATLITQLNAGAAVTIDTGGAGAENGDITLVDNLDLTSITGSSLTLNAANDIILNASINDTGIGLALNFTADSGIVVPAENNNVGEIFVNNFINTSGGAVTLNAGSGITFSISGAINTGNANLSAVTSTGSIDFVQSGVTAIDSGTGVVTLTADQIFDNSSVDLDVIADVLTLQTVSGAGFIGGELDTQVNTLTFNNTGTTGVVAVINNSATGLTASGTNLSDDFSVIVKIEENTGGLDLNNITGGNNGDLLFNAGTGDITLLPAQSILSGTNSGFISLSSGGAINLGAGSLLKTQSGLSDIFLDAFDIIFPGATIDAGGAKVFFNQVNTAAIGVGTASGTTGLEVDDAELSNIVAGLVMFGSSTAGLMEISANIDMGLLGYDLFLASAVDLNFQAGSSINVSGGTLSLYAPSFDFSAISQQISGTGIIEFVNLVDSPSIELSVDCASQIGAVCVSQANLNDLTDGFSSIRFVTASAGAGGIEVTSAMSFQDNVEIDTSFSNGDINLAAGLNLAGNDIVMNAGAGAINFNLAATSEIIANDVVLDAATITNVVSTAPDIVSNTLSFNTANGFGSNTNPFLTSVSQIVSGINSNSAFEIFIDNDTPLYIQSLTQGAGTGLSVSVYNEGDITIGQIDGGGNTVILDTAAANNAGVGGSIFDDGFGQPNISNVFRAELYSENGVGDVVNNIELTNINDGDIVAGGLFVSAEGSGDIFINNVGGGGSAFDIQAVITGANGDVFIHNSDNLQATNLNSSIVTTAGNITLESNSAINLIASLNAGGGSDVNVTLLSGSGDITINGGVLSSNAVNLTNNMSGITFGSTGFVLAPSVNLSANGVIDDSAAAAAIGNGSPVGLLSAIATGNINLTSAGNDANVLYLQSNTGNVTYLDSNDISLDQIIATGSASITSGGEIFDNNGGVQNITANTATVNAVNGIGALDQIETSITTSLDFNNSTDGTVHFLDLSTNDIQFWGINNSVNSLTTDFTQLNSQNGSITVPSGQSLSSLNTDIILDVVTPGQLLTIDGTVSISNAASRINLLAPVLNISATGNVSAPGTASLLSVLLKVDDFNLTSGGIVNGGVGDLAFENLTDGNSISIGGASGDMDLSAIDLAALSAGRIGIGQNGGVGTSSIIIEGAVNFSIDTKLASVGDITFNQGASNGITSTANVEMNTEGAIIDLSAGVDVVGNGLFLFAENGIGDLNAIDTQASGLQVFNGTSGAINVDNNTGNLSIAFINQNAAAAAVNVTSTGGIAFIYNGIDLPGVTSVGGDVTIASTTSLIVDGGASAIGPHIFGANSVTLNSATGVGTLATPIEIEDMGVGGLTVSSALTNGIYVDNVVGSLTSDFIINGVTAGSGEVLINNFNAAQDTQISGATSLAGSNFSIRSLASMFVDGNIVDTLGGQIDLQVNGVGGSLFVNNATIQSATGVISLLADTDVMLNGTTNLQTSLPGVITLTATNGQVFADPTASITGGGDLNVSANTGVTLSSSNDVGSLGFNTVSGNIVYSDINDIFLGVIDAPIVGGSVTITSAGAIIDSNGVANNITAQTVSLNAANGIGTPADPIELAAQNYFNFSNSTAGDVVVINSVANSILLSGINLGGDVNVSYDNTMQVLDVSAAGNMVLTSINGSIIDSNDAGSPVLNLSAANLDLTAFNSIGGGAGGSIETQLAATGGSINVNNTSTTLGDFEIENWAVNATDVAIFTANNVALNGSVILLNPLGVMQAGNITSNQSFIELKGLDLNLAGTVNNNDAAGVYSVLLVADDIDLAGGALNANNGVVEIFTLTNGRGMTLGAVDATGNTLDLVQADVAAITAADLSIGLLDTVTPWGTGEINIAGPLDIGATNLKLQTLGNIIFTNGTQSGLSTTGLMEVESDLAIIGDNSTGINLTASNLSIKAKLGIGSVDAIRTQVTDLTAFNQFSSNLNISNTGALIVSDSANLAGSMSLISDSTLTLTPFAGLAGTTGAVASTDLTLQAANGLFINGVVSATNINLLSDNAVTINETVTATGNLLIDGDADLDGIGDVLIENVNGGILSVSSANMSLKGASINLNATSGAVHIESAGLLNVVASSSLNIVGGSLLDADAYLSAQGNINMDIGANVLLMGGAGDNTAASIFDVSGTNQNILNMTVDGNVTLTAGIGASSGAYITAGEVNMTVLGDMSLTGGAANLSPAKIEGFALNMLLDVTGSLSLIDGAGVGSLAQVVSNNGLGYMQVSYLDCVGCANGLLFLDQPIVNTATNEIVSTQNGSVITLSAAVSSSDALIAILDESTASLSETDVPVASDAETTTAADGEEEAPEEEVAAEAPALVCR